ncbi:hypothetical protein Barb6_01883 [Bacteroidales bacterium Barb6]|nr:hypothetical protein Barb6_01883 [Bacteroidales bacterium Barb6]
MLKENIRLYLYACLVVLAFVLLPSGCRSARKVAVADAVTAKAHAEFFELMESRAYPFQTLSARMNAELVFPGKEVSSRIDLKMTRDSAFVLSVQPLLGIEMFRIRLTPDSVTVIDRMNQRYVSEGYAGLQSRTAVAFNFYNLQALLVNHLFYPGEQGLSSEHYHRFLLKQEGVTAEVKAKDAAGLLYTFTADGDEKLLSVHISDASESFAVQWLYDKFSLTDGGRPPFPMLMDVKLFSDGAAQGSVKMNFSRVQADVPVQTDAVVPAKYRRITLSEILKSLSK